MICTKIGRVPYVIWNEDFSVFFRPLRGFPSTLISVPHDGLIRNDFSGVFKERTIGWKGSDLHVWPIVNDMLVQTVQDGFTFAAYVF